MTADELAEVDKKVLEIEKGVRGEDVDEDDAGNYNFNPFFFL
jgi:hypothetical protein